MSFEVRRENFEKLLKKYKEYIELYRLVNNGSTEGVTSFDEFYLRLTYYDRYNNALKIGGAGY
jgi:hypothetical protein